jgi:hypothetical protein
VRVRDRTPSADLRLKGRSDPAGTEAGIRIPERAPGQSVERRRRTRHTVEWIVEYSLGASVEWHRCRLVDLAETGATIEPFDPIDNSASGEVALRFQLPEDIAGPFAILGDIRHVTRIPEGSVRLGIEFENLSTRDVMLLNLVARSHSFA